MANSKLVKSLTNLFVTYKCYIPILIIILLPIFFFIKPALGLSIIVLGDFTGSDLLDLHYPFRVAFSESVRHFTLPLWTPNLSMGFPLLAEGQTGMLYPPNLLLALLHPVLALNWSIILALIIAGIGTYLYTRNLGFSRFSALVSALVFMFSAFFVTRAKHLNMIEVASLVPFLFWGTKKLFEKLNWHWAVFLGAILGLQFLAGHPQMTFFSILIFTLYFFFEFWLAAKKKGFDKVFHTLLYLITALVLGLSVAAIQILPTLELTQQSERTNWTLYSATSYPFTPKNLLTFISPYYFGNPATGSYRENVQTDGVFWENASYIGLLPLLLAFLTIFITLRNILTTYLGKTPGKYPHIPQTPHFLFLGFLIIFSLLMMLGRSTPVFGFFWENIPGFALFRFPTRFNLFLIFSLSILAGFGAQKLADKLERLRFAKSDETEEEFHFSWPLRNWQTQVLIIGLIMVDLFVFAKSYFGEIPSSDWLKKPSTINLFKDQEPFRIWSVTQYGQSPYQALGWQKDQEALLSIRQALPPNSNLIFNLDSFSDRGWFEGGLSLRKRNRLERLLLEGNLDEITMAKLLGMFNVRYILTFAERGGFEMTEIANVDLGREFGTPLRVFENGENMPRYYFVPEAKVIPDEEALLTAMMDQKFLPIRTVLLEKGPRQVPQAFSGSLDDFKKDNPLTLEKYGATEVIINTQIKNHGFLVLSDSYYPGWKVQVDNQEKEILPANFLVRAVELTPGEHKVRFYFDPFPFKIGAIISLSTVVFLLLLVLSQLKSLKKLKFLKQKNKNSQNRQNSSN